MSVCGVSPGSPFSIKLAQIHSAGRVLCAPISGGLIGPSATLDVALSTCLHSIASKPVMAAVVSLGQYRACSLDEP